MNLKGQVAVITGGSSEIGMAGADAFLAEGVRVVLAAARSEAVQAAVELLKDAHPDACIKGIHPDFTSWEEVQEAFRAISDDWGRVDILLNCSHITDSTPLAKQTVESYEKIMDLNVKAAFLCAKAAAVYMERQHSGVIINTSSIAGRTGQSCGPVYPASMAALDGLTLSLARELAPKGIRVNAVATGLMENEHLKSIPKDTLQALIDQIPLGRLGKPEDCANAFVFLASEKASYISGLILRADGLARM